MQRDDYYVYVYIDPRNHEEFYYGKGRGSRKGAHLNDRSDSDKATRIADIRKDGLEPFIRVIARGLTQAEALLVEKTLLWKLGKWTLNIATGHFAKKFRPPNKLHKELSGFDFQNSLYYYSVGDGISRNWDDYVKFGFISAGWGPQYRDTMLAFNEGDIFAAHMSGKGFVGVGKILKCARMIREVKVNRRPLLELVTSPSADHDRDDPEKSEYVCLVKWLKWVPREKAKWRPRSNLFAKPLVRASLDSQPETVKFIEEAFGISIRSKLK